MKKWRIAAIFAAVLLVAIVVFAYETSNYREQGGARWVIGGSCDVASGGEIDIESGGALKLAGTAITATAAEVNILDGVTATAAELNLVDGANILGYGTMTIANGQTTKEVTLTGATASTRAVVTPTDAYTSASYCYASCSADAVSVTINTDNGADLIFNYIAIGP